MPEIDGLSVCARLLDPDRKPLNVVVVTGSRNPENLERCEGFGAFYTRKGVNFWSELEAVLTEIYPGLAENINRSDKCSSAVLETRIRPRVLLVDDDADVSRLLSTRLSKFGVDTLYAVNPVQGYRIACREEPSVIISDYFMPDGGAEYLLARLRTTPATQDIPVIVLSGRELSEVIQQNLRREICQHSGAALILRKSVDTTELLDVLRKYCGFEVNLDGTRRDARHVAEVCVGKGLS
jgi:CheY-like chemotaxis protein